MRVADTSAIYAFFDQDDDHHARARKEFEDPSPMVVPSEVFAELMFVLTRKLGADKAHDAGQFLWSQANTEVQPSDTALVMAAWGEFEASHRKLTFVDCVVVAWSRERGLEPLAYDKAILRAARA